MPRCRRQNCRSVSARLIQTAGGQRSIGIRVTIAVQFREGVVHENRGHAIAHRVDAADGEVAGLRAAVAARGADAVAAAARIGTRLVTRLLEHDAAEAVTGVAERTLVRLTGAIGPAGRHTVVGRVAVRVLTLAERRGVAHADDRLASERLRDVLTGGCQAVPTVGPLSLEELFWFIVQLSTLLLVCTKLVRLKLLLLNSPAPYWVNTVVELSDVLELYWPVTPYVS